MKSILLTTLAVVALGALLACGTPGAPQPPSLELPRRVQNLQAIRKGSKVSLLWTTPRETTDRKRIKHLGPTRICRAVDVVAPAQCMETVGTLLPGQTPIASLARFTDTLPEELQKTHPSGFASYSVEVENSRGRSAGLSNEVLVPLAPTPPPPSQISAHVTADGVEVSASGAQFPSTASLSFVYHCYRRMQGEKPESDLGPVSVSEESGQAYRLSCLDRSAEWEKTYFYKLAAVTTENVQGKQETIAGDDSPEIEVFVHDIFPPATPTGLEAVSSGTPQQPFIDLSWSPNTESDLAGYNVYRHEQGAAPVKINSELVKSPTYRDSAVEASRRYFYSVTAVDVRGNESGRSAEVSEQVPQ